MNFVIGFAVVCLNLLMISVEGCPKTIKEYFNPTITVLTVSNMGCYPGEAHFTAMEYDSMKLSLCNTHCYRDGFKYMALQGNKCFCETYLDPNEKQDDSKCNLMCKGDETEKCGGDGYYSAFTTAKNFKKPT